MIESLPDTDLEIMGPFGYDMDAAVFITIHGTPGLYDVVIASDSSLIKRAEVVEVERIGPNVMWIRIVRKLPEFIRLLRERDIKL